MRKLVAEIERLNGGIREYDTKLRELSSEN